MLWFYINPRRVVAFADRSSPARVLGFMAQTQ